MGACVSCGASSTRGGSEQQKKLSGQSSTTLMVPETPVLGAIPSLRDGQPLCQEHEGSNGHTSIEQTVVPSPLSKAPAEVTMPLNCGSDNQAPPYIPAPGVPPPESPTGRTSKRWKPDARRAVIVGCNYVGNPQAQLQGCVNDAHCLKQLLMTSFGYLAEEIVFLHDEQPHTQFLPTKKNILAALNWLLGDQNPCTALIFAFSGRSAEASPDEGLQTGSSEGILPCDYAQGGILSDLDINEALISRLQPGARLHCAIDATPFGLSVGLPYKACLRQDGWAAWEEAGAQALAQRKATLSNTRSTSHTALAFRGTNGGEVVIFSNTADEYTEDALPFQQHSSLGAIGFSLRQAVIQNQSETYNCLLRAMWLALKNGPQQYMKMPEISSSHEFDLNRPFSV